MMICSGLRSELPSVLVYPSLDDDLLIRVKLYGVTSLSVQIAEETVLPSSEWEIGHGRGHSDINADVACRGFVPESARRRPAGCEKRSLVAIGLRSKNAIASSMSRAWIKLSTGPKISVSASSLDAGTPSRIVGFTKFPDSCFGILAFRPSRRTFAPSFSPTPISDSTRDLLCGLMTVPFARLHPGHCPLAAMRPLQ